VPLRFSNTTRPYVSCCQRYKNYYLVSPKVRCHRPFRHVMESSKCHLLLSFSLGRWFRSRRINAALICPGEASGSMMAKVLAENKREVVLLGLSATRGLLRPFPSDGSCVSWNNLPRSFTQSHRPLSSPLKKSFARQVAIAFQHPSSALFNWATSFMSFARSMRVVPGMRHITRSQAHAGLSQSPCSKLSTKAPHRESSTTFFALR